MASGSVRQVRRNGASNQFDGGGETATRAAMLRAPCPSTSTIP